MGICPLFSVEYLRNRATCIRTARPSGSLFCEYNHIPLQYG